MSFQRGGCLVEDSSGGAGRTLSVRRTAAIGDCLAASIVAIKLREQGFMIWWQTHPAIAPVMRRCPSIAQVVAPMAFTHCDLDHAYEENRERRTKHFYEFFMERAQFQLRTRGINLGPTLNCRPVLTCSAEAKRASAARLAAWPKPWIGICSRSINWANRTIPDETWSRAAGRISGTCFWLVPSATPRGIVPLNIGTIEPVMDFIAAMDLVVSVDTGPMHIAAALGIPVLAIGQASSPELHLGDQCDFETIYPAGLDCLNCQQNICPINADRPPCQKIDPDRIAAAVNRKLGIVTDAGVSVVIPIYRPPHERLMKCINAVLPQVDEVIITMEAKGILPADLSNPPDKIRVVRTKRTGIGFGRNVNFGFRHTNFKRVLILNDDVFLAPNAVAQLKREIRAGVGLVGQLLYMPDGRIYHGGVARAVGSLDWGHLDYGAKRPSITQPQEMEQVTGASILLDRRAFYEAGAFDEMFFAYCEDNDLCMRIRQAGWKIMYTPHATGVHEVSQSMKAVRGIDDIRRQSERYSHQKWDWYLRRNQHVAGLGTFK
jgi:GT2 family glycosyltransferase/ADP-heptose:LPS heptosyltransferase